MCRSLSRLDRPRNVDHTLGSDETTIALVDVRAVMVAVVVLAAKLSSAQTDEIQVYDAGIAEKGKFNLTWHNNFTPAGVTAPAFPGALIADKSLNGVSEWAYGVTDWFEAGLYLPLYSVGTQNPSRGAGAMLDGFKMRLLFVAPHADDRRFFYGANFEFSDNARHWDSVRFTSEVRLILGWTKGSDRWTLKLILSRDLN